MGVLFHFIGDADVTFNARFPLTGDSYQLYLQNILMESR
jgi:hypothetical protein